MQKYSVTDYLSLGNGEVSAKVAKVEINNGYVTSILKRDKGAIIHLTPKEMETFRRLRDKTTAKVFLSKIVNKRTRTAK